MTPTLDVRRVTLAAVVVIVLAAGITVVGSDDGRAATPESSSVADLTDEAKQRTGEVRRIQAAANRIVVQWVGGVGIGLGLGLVVGGYGTYRYQRRRLKKEFS
jgi:hypothetical protein